MRCLNVASQKLNVHNCKAQLTSSFREGFISTDPRCQLYGSRTIRHTELYQLHPLSLLPCRECFISTDPRCHL